MWPPHPFDSDDNTIRLAGYTASTDAQAGQAPNVYQSSNHAASIAGPPATAAFVTELNPAIPGLSGILYSSYLSGNGFVSPAVDFGNVGFGEAATGIAYHAHSLYITGITTSGDTGPGHPYSTSFPVVNGCFTANNSAGITFDSNQVHTSSFVARLDPNNLTGGAAELGFSTLLGGHAMADIAGGIQFDPNFTANGATGAIVVAGLTYSNDFPVVNAFQSSDAAGGQGQAFLSVIDPNGTLGPGAATSTARHANRIACTVSFA